MFIQHVEVQLRNRKLCWDVNTKIPREITKEIIKEDHQVTGDSGGLQRGRSVSGVNHRVHDKAQSIMISQSRHRVGRRRGVVRERNHNDGNFMKTLFLE